MWGSAGGKAQSREAAAKRPDYSRQHLRSYLPETINFCKTKWRVQPSHYGYGFQTLA